MTRKIPPLFDSALRASRQRRALVRARYNGLDPFYLHQWVADRLAERLDDTPFPFEKIAIVGGVAQPFAEAIAGRPGLAAVECVATAEALEPKAFDAVLSGLELHALDDPIGALIQMRAALKPNGYLLAALFAGDSLTELRHALAAAEPGGPQRVAPFGELRDLGGLLGRSGFAMPVADIDKLTLWHADPLALMRELRAMGEANCLINGRKTLSRKTLAQLMAVYAERFQRADGKVGTTVEVAFLTGWRPGPGQPLPKKPGSATASLADALGASAPLQTDKQEQ